MTRATSVPNCQWILVWCWLRGPCQAAISVAQGVDVGNAAIQTLAGEDGEFAFGHIEPTAMLGGVVKLQLARDPAGFVRREGLVQGGGVWVLRLSTTNRMRSAVGKYNIDQQLHLPGKVLLVRCGGDVDVTPAAQGLDETETDWRCLPFVFAVIARGLTGTGRQRMTGLRWSIAPDFRQSRLGDSADHRARHTDPGHLPYARRSRD